MATPCGWWQQAGNDPHGLHRSPRDRPTPLWRRFAAAPAGAGPGRFGGDAPPQTIDKYGRTVAEVFRGGQNTNLAMVSSGQAFAYRKYLSACDGSAYLGAEAAAQRKRVGVWAVPGGIQRPWDWRKGTRPPAASTAAPFLS
jgi:hypothetical protein